MYLLDTNVFITAHRDMYRPDVFPGFWDWLRWCAGRERIHSIAAVRDELTQRQDLVAGWASQHATNLFIEPTANLGEFIKTVADWVRSQPYAERHIRAFFDRADLWLIAQAMALGYTVVTFEVSGGANTTKVKIPTVCAGLNVDCIGVYDLLSRERARFVIDPGILSAGRR